jgi:hypothetical protein
VKRTIAALVAGLVLGGAGVGIAADQNTPSRFYRISPDALVEFPGLDLACNYFAKLNKDKTDPGPTMLCDRLSSVEQRLTSRSIFVTRYHFEVSSSFGKTYRFTRSP